MVDSLLLVVLGLLGSGAQFLAPVWALVVLGKAVSVALPGRRPDWRTDLLRWWAWAGAAGALIAYLTGAFSVSAAVSQSSHGADSTPAQECRDDPRAGHVVGQRHSWLPLRFDCVLDDGTSYPGDPWIFWANALAAALALSAALAAIGLGYVAELRARKQL
ncbi:hypothetical protein KUM39_12850 [Streptomyces sp. J2-1]|uniref:hypothetical protein n=1 Tax=Streptomyces corallincola TaxID=2851888 RepID=UPI001C3910CB|nr:hypothetical protein [Streptomyces corallincola]MBV2355248.1 hypothetical protein [Streptomyces corallincola]